MTNRLADQTSLYLRQHADNPVDWFPWGEEALAKARESNTPILLSIGYSACHWCHVMAHESFEDAQTAELMNRLFVNIKVDREERPDLDRIYQLAHQAFARRPGGWPLTVFLAPDELVPFYAGTYFPPTPRHGLPSFRELLQGVRRWYDDKPEDVRAQNEAMQRFLADYGRFGRHEGALEAAPVSRARERLAARFDPEHGGSRGAPKFPHATELMLLARLARRGDGEAGAMRATTLRHMAEGGLTDHVGGGFFRYCVDAHWGIPHFEKMLYDNALLLPELCHAGFEDEALDACAGALVGWLEREMRLPGGGYAAALDADAEGGEGAFYVWTPAQFEAELGAPLAALAGARFGLDGPPNFEGEAWHLRLRRTPDEAASASGFAGDAAAALADATTRLLAARERRPRPARDDKRLTAWNALLASGLLRAGLARGREDWQQAGLEVLDTLRNWHRFDDGRLAALHDGHGPRLAGQLDDHAFVLRALLDGLAVRWSSDDLDWAIALAGTLESDFADPEQGGFYMTPCDHEPLPQRPKPWFDEATPSGNGIAAISLLELGWLLADPRLLELAENSIRAGLAAAEDAPDASPSLMLALDALLEPAPMLVLRLAPEDGASWSAEVAAVRASGGRAWLLPANDDELPEALRLKAYRPGGVAYLCRGTHCEPPITLPDQLLAAFRAAG